VPNDGIYESKHVAGIAEYRHKNIAVTDTKFNEVMEVVCWQSRFGQNIGLV